LRLVLALSALLLLADVTAAARPVETGKGSRQTIESRIIGVIDGDTIRVRSLEPTRKPAYTVRLIGIDAPEAAKPGRAGECGAREATSSMFDLGFSAPRHTDGDDLFDERGGRGRAVRLVTDSSQARFDRSGRLLAHVDLSGGATLAVGQLGRGWAKVEVLRKRFSRFKAFGRAQARARRADRGAWNLCNGNFHRPLAETARGIPRPRS
jgi:endonuclease YncB( thermonuclease family)